MASGSSPDQSGVGEESDSRPPLDKGKGIDRKVHPKASQVSDREGLSVRAARADSELYDDLPLVVWCPQIVATFRNFFSPETAAFLFSLPRKPAALRGHSGCSNTRCMANDTLLAEGGRYSSAHWKSCTGSLNCVFLGPEPQKIRDIIESGGIPLISIECGKDGRLKLDAIKATGRSKYIAVSHVWSGGLGNPHENSLPSCQIHRLFDMWPELISKTHSKPARGIWRWPKPTKALFWMDTLCIPLGKEHFYLKMRAINSMAKTYANAQAIIIFDHELQQTSHFDMPVSQIVGLIACSAWMSRCWTFQEGAMAKKWLLQFEDGIWCLDDIQEDPLSRREDHSALHELVELLKFFANVPRLISTVNQRTFSQRKFEAKIALFSQVWNGLCTRSTTKREDLISIIAIILDFRPAELLRIPAENRLLSLICAQEVLPLSLIYRERLGLKDWSEAYQWLPSTIEEKPIEVNGDMMWRRSPEEDFFILKFFSKVTDPKERKTRIYFMKTLVECDTSSLRLIDDDTGEKIIVDLQLPGDLRLPQLDICIMIGEIELVGPPLSAYGACLGIRHRDATRIQLYYICAVKCILVHPESRDYALPQNDCRTRVKQETILETTELAIEHKFPPSSTLLEPRPLGDFPHSFEARRAVLRGPFAVQSFAYLFFWIASGFFWHDRGTGPRLGVSLGLFWARVVALYFENCFWHFSFAEAEFDEWYGGLYGDKVILGGTPFNIYHCPSVVYATLGLGLLAWPFFWLLERLLPGQRMLREVVFLVCEFELGLLIVKWLLEVSVQAALRVMFPPSQQLSEESRARVWYFKTFYAKSRLTTILERVLQVAWSALTFQPRRYPTSPSDHGFSEPTASGATALFETSEFIDDPSREPWSTKNVKVFEPTTDSQNLRYENSLERLPTSEPDIFHEPHEYLNALLATPYTFLNAYWTLLSTWSLITYFLFRLKKAERKLQILFLVVIFINVMYVRHLFGHPLAMWWFGHKSSADARFSIHFGTATTTLLLCICLPLTMLLVYPHSFPALVVSSSICAALVLGHLLLLWLIELYGHYRHTNPGPFGPLGVYAFENDLGQGYDALDECYRRLYSKSRFTRWVEMLFRGIHIGCKNWLAAWRRRGLPSFSAVGRSRNGSDTGSAYTDDREEDFENLLNLVAEDD